MKRIVTVVLTALFISACAGTARDCSSGCASEFGADWIVVQYANDGHALACWQLHDTAVTNEKNTDGIYWKDGGHLVHISGWYNRVQVDGEDFAGAATLLGIDLRGCQGGKYVAQEAK